MQLHNPGTKRHKFVALAPACVVLYNRIWRASSCTRRARAHQVTVAASHVLVSQAPLFAGDWVEMTASVMRVLPLESELSRVHRGRAETASP